MIKKQWLNGAANFIALVTLFSSQNIPTYAQGHSGRDAEGNLNVSLLKGAKCTSFAKPNNLANTKLIKEKNNVSIDNQYYESPFKLVSKLESSATLTCLVDSQKYRLLKIKMGIPDHYHPSTRIKVHLYQGGKVMFTHNGVPGMIMDSILYMNNPKVPGKAHNISIEMVCQSGSGPLCNLLFLQAELIHI